MDSAEDEVGLWEVIDAAHHPQQLGIVGDQLDQVLIQG
jgi:hypothetical protein